MGGGLGIILTLRRWAPAHCGWHPFLSWLLDCVNGKSEHRRRRLHLSWVWGSCFHQAPDVLPSTPRWPVPSLSRERYNRLLLSGCVITVTRKERDTLCFDSWRRTSKGFPDCQTRVRICGLGVTCHRWHYQTTLVEIICDTKMVSQVSFPLMEWEVGHLNLNVPHKSSV